MSKTGLQALPKVRRSMKEVSPMEHRKIYLLAELTILPAYLRDQHDSARSSGAR